MVILFRNLKGKNTEKELMSLIFVRMNSAFSFQVTCRINTSGCMGLLEELTKNKLTATEEFLTQMIQNFLSSQALRNIWVS